ncbi:MAG: NAD(P)H-binding protein, partial [Deltaproteobacteria bacterium]|nr:NAD(P)H-binding protein [Deltaproteobacteria bacterium]
TGATGFIGYHVTRLLREQQCDIRALVRPASEVAELKTLGVELLTVGIRNEADLARELLDSLRGLTCISLPGRAETYRLPLDLHPTCEYKHVTRQTDSYNKTMNSYPNSSETNPEISVIVPVYNEAPNIEPLVMHLPAEFVVHPYYKSSGKRIYAVREVLE